MCSKAKDIKFKKLKNKEYLSTLSTVKWKQDIGDEQLAKILQEKYNKESASYISQCVSNPDNLNNDDSDIEDIENIDDTIYWEKFDSALKEFDPIPLYNGQGKHNTSSNIKFKNSHEIHIKTRSILDKMLMNGVFDNISGLTTTGKEAVIFNAHKEIMSSGIVTLKFYVVKIYKIRQPISYWIYNYKTGKYKYTIRYPRNTKLALSKAKREMLYYERIKNAGMPCPEVIALEEHVIVLSVVGDSKPAPSVLCAQIKEGEKLLIVYKQIVKYMKTLYVKCNLIHGDLSGGNILWYNDTCYFIDLGQSVESHKQQAFHLLYNDCKNICNHFVMLNVPKVLSAEDLFLEITGYNYLNRFSLAQLQEIEVTKHKNKNL